eukprot:2072302-Amphidinium_carterae.1
MIVSPHKGVAHSVKGLSFLNTPAAMQMLIAWNLTRVQSQTSTTLCVVVVPQHGSDDPNMFNNTQAG